MRRCNNDVLIGVESSWRPFLLFSCRKDELYTKLLVFEGTVTRTCMQNPYYCERLLLEYMQNSCSLKPAHGTRSPAHISMNPVSVSCGRQLVLCEYSKFRFKSNSYFSIRFNSKRIQLFQIFEYLPITITNFLLKKLKKVSL